MSKDLAIVSEYNDCYEEAYSGWSSFYPLANRDHRFYLGDQWDAQERKKLHEEGRLALVFNKARRSINNLTGRQRQRRLSSVVVPIENSDQLAADQLSQLLLFVMQASDGYQTISDCFGGACKTGWNLMTIWMDYRDDPVNGDIKFGREPYSGFITDPNLTNLDFSDCNYIIRRKYLALDQAASMLPGQEKDVKKLHATGWSRDDKFTWLSYQKKANGQNLLAFDELYRQKWKNVPMLVDIETGEFLEWNKDEDRLAYFRALYPDMKVIQRPKRYIEKHIILNNQYMRTEINPYGLNEYPFVPFVGLFEPEADLCELKVQSLMRCMIDPQREINRRRSQMIDIFDSQINSGFIADEDSVVNPRSLFQSSQGKVIWRKKDAKPGAIEKIIPGQVPPSMFQFQETLDRDLPEILGTNDAAFGIPNNGVESGVVTLLRQGAAITSLQDVLDNLRYSQKMICKKALKLIQTWTPKKIEKIINQRPSEQFYNEDFVKYDVTVQEGVLTDTQQQMNFHQLANLKQITSVPDDSPVTNELLVDAAPIQGKSALQQQIKKNKQAKEQAAQQQAQSQQQIVQAQNELVQANSIERIAAAKERFTRAVANMGLEDERAARAIQDRSSAVLNNIKAAAEIQNISQEQLLKALKIVRMMEEFSGSKEEQIKQDDVSIAASAGQEAALAGQQPVDESIAQNLTPEMANG